MSAAVLSLVGSVPKLLDGIVSPNLATAEENWGSLHLIAPTESWRSLESETLQSACISVPCGAKAVQGGRQTMEDTYCIHRNLHDSLTKDVSAAFRSSCHLSELAFFGVFDGHGGSDVAQHCANKLHRHFADMLSQLATDVAAPTTSGSSDDSLDDSIELTLTSPTFASELPSPQHPKRSSNSGSSETTSSPICDALRAAFRKTDFDLRGSESGDFVGSTAVVAVVGPRHLYIANCGDSRAVISQHGVAQAVTCDHKPDREDEAARVQQAGGRIVFTSGSYRVSGMLAMSRAIGDHFLRPYVIAEPEFTILERSADDEVLVMATDGLWDVFSCQDATSLALRCITKAMDKGMGASSACRVAASVLTKAALDRGSRDNITVLVIDLRPTHTIIPACPGSPPIKRPEVTTESPRMRHRPARTPAAASLADSVHAAAPGTACAAQPAGARVAESCDGAIRAWMRKLSSGLATIHVDATGTCDGPETPQMPRPQPEQLPLPASDHWGAVHTGKQTLFTCALMPHAHVSARATRKHRLHRFASIPAQLGCREQCTRSPDRRPAKYQAVTRAEGDYSPPSRGGTPLIIEGGDAVDAARS